MLRKQKRAQVITAECVIDATVGQTQAMWKLRKRASKSEICVSTDRSVRKKKIKNVSYLKETPS